MLPDRPRIVVADDSIDVLSSLTALLEANGYDTRPVSSGEEAIERVAQCDPECVMLDICMPGGGTELVSALRQRFGSALVLIGMTGLDQGDDRVSAVRSLVDYLFLKPIDVELLESILPPCSVSPTPAAAGSGRAGPSE